MNAKQISEMLAKDAANVASYLLKGGKKQGPEWKAGSVSGEAGNSLSVRLTGSKAGIWSDFSTGEKGDLLDLFMAVYGYSFPEALAEAKRFLNVTDSMPERPAKTYTRPAKPKGSQTPVSRVREWLNGRGITDETIDVFKVREVQRNGATWALFPYLRDGVYVNAKYRNPDDKKGMGQEADAEPCLFGWHLVQPKDRSIVICEGEIDAMTLWQAGVSALSVNAGAGNHQWIENDWEKLERFSDIVISFDHDEAGDKGAAEIIKRLGVERCRRMRMPSKDANQWLMDGASDSDFKEAVRAAKPQDPDEMKASGEFMNRLVSMFYPAADADVHPKLVLDRTFEWFDFRPGELTVWTGYNGHGKALSLDTPIPTPSGWANMGDLKPGDRVFDENGNPCNVVAVTEIMNDRPCYRVTFNDGTEIIADANHEWLTHTAKARTSWRTARRNDRLELRELAKRGNDQSAKRAMPEIVTTQEIAESLLVAEKTYNGKTNHSIPVCGVLNLPEQALPIDPYVLGAWLGDGHSNCAAITSDDPEIVGRIAGTGVTVHKRTAKYLYGLKGGLQTILRKHGLLNNKHIPDVYMRASQGQRLALLQGLMDTDGYITDYGRCEFTSVLQPLADQVLELVRSLGIQAMLINGIATLNGRDCGPKYRVTFTPHIQVFHLSRKANKVKDVVSCRIRHRFIVACELVESVPVRCIQVDSESHLFLASKAMIPTHNSLLLSQVQLGLMAQGERFVVFSGEMQPEYLLKRLVKQATGLDRPTPEYIKTVFDWLNDKFWIFNQVGSATMKRLIEVFGYANKRYGVGHVVIDSLMMTDVPEDGPGAMTLQKEAIRNLCDFAKKSGVHIHLVAHPRKGRDESAGPGKSDVAGSSKITDGADNVFVVWRAQKDQAEPSPSDQAAHDKWTELQEAPDAKLILKKQRNGNHQDYTQSLWFDSQSMQYRTQKRNNKNTRYVDFSSRAETETN